MANDSSTPPPDASGARQTAALEPAAVAQAVKRMRLEVGKVVIGQHAVVEQMLMALISGGHCLLIGVPGLAKTVMAKTLADVLDMQFRRVQFTPDLMPGDITGTDKGQYQISGHGPYMGYHSPMWDIAAGMLMGSMMSRMFMPGYSPMYTTPYTTPASSRGALMNQRNSYRTNNPEKFRAQQSKSGRSYGKKGGGFGGGQSSPPPRAPSRGGGRFGSRRVATGPVARLVE